MHPRIWIHDEYLLMKARSAKERELHFVTAL
jgi:hypothetical protein